MKVFKKIITISLVTALIILPITSYADNSFSNAAEAKVLNDLGLYKGTSPTEFKPDLGGSLDRQTGVVMLLRLFGQETAALQLSDAETETALAGFKDAGTIPSWAKKYVAYAVQNQLAKGLPDGTFAPKAPLNGKAYSTLILRQLGYSDDFNYNDAATFLSSKGGLTAAQSAAVNSNAPLIRNDLIGMSFGALQAKPKNTDSTVLQALIASGIISKDTAKDALKGTGITIDEAATKATSGSTTSSPSKHKSSNNPDAEIIDLGDFFDITAGETIAVPFAVSPSGAAVTATSSNTSVASVTVSGSETSYTLNIKTTELGTANVILSVSASGYDSVSKTITVTSSHPDATIFGLESVQVAVGEKKSISFTVSPADAVVTFSNNTTNAAVTITGSGTAYALDITGSAIGTSSVTITASAADYDSTSKAFIITIE